MRTTFYNVSIILYNELFWRNLMKFNLGSTLNTLKMGAIGTSQMVTAIY